MALKEQLDTNVPQGYRGGLKLGDEQFLWLLVLAEVGLLAALRSGFRRQHGG